jgi:hypothetical protein
MQVSVSGATSIFPSSIINVSTNSATSSSAHTMTLAADVPPGLATVDVTFPRRVEAETLASAS